MLTKPLILKGNHLVLNYATSAVGGIRIEVQDDSGQPMPGFSLDSCREIYGDELERVVVWDHGSKLSRLQGTSVRLRIKLWDADLFSIRTKD